MQEKNRNEAFKGYQTEDAMRKRLSDAIFHILESRQKGKTCCPSEAARRVDPHGWRDLMILTRDVARTLRKEGRLDICQRGHVITADEWTGPIRLRLCVQGNVSKTQKDIRTVLGKQSALKRKHSSASDPD
ncbi:hypothetical protein BaRGS_00025568 [Batillaria attramentaria]|uniref:DUF3253 domain-containing protein n=1 Tax=Batillaria attramentaria TaxID=370345 RepID=A0ABD0K7H7_9CAEN